MLVYFDANIAVYTIEGHAQHLPALDRLAFAIEAGAVTSPRSPVT